MKVDQEDREMLKANGFRGGILIGDRNSWTASGWNTDAEKKALIQHAKDDGREYLILFP